MSSGHDHSHGHHHHHHHHHHHGHDGTMNQDDFDKHATAADWEGDALVLFLNEKLASTVLERHQGSFNTNETSVLDFGCGTGLMTSKVCESVASVVGVDLSPAMIEVYNKKKHANSKGVCLDMKELHPSHLDGQQFDFILACYSLHHVEDPGSMVKLLTSYLKPGGKLLFGEFVRKAEDTDAPNFFFTSGQLTGWLNDAGLEDISEDIIFQAKPDKLPKSQFVDESKRNMFMRVVLAQGVKGK